MKKTKGFTLIELLVVIAIIGILATVILVSLNSARSKSRDARRVSDLRQVSLALEMYASENATYPPAASCGTTSASFNTMAGTLVTAGFLPSVPADPAASATLYYAYAGSTSDYVLKATLENTNSDLLDNDLETAPTGLTCTCTDPAYCVGP